MVKIGFENKIRLNTVFYPIRPYGRIKWIRICFAINI